MLARVAQCTHTYTCVFIHNLYTIMPGGGNESYAQFAVDKLLAAAWRVKTLSPKCLERNRIRTNFHTAKRAVERGRGRCVYTHTHARLDTVVYTFAAHLIAAFGQLACGCLAWRLCLQIFAQMFANLTQVAFTIPLHTHTHRCLPLFPLCLCLSLN